MKLNDILNNLDRPLISCEFFPPRTDKGEENLWRCLSTLQTIHPDYVSVTYGAGGSTQERTRRIVTRIKQETDLEPVAHLTCVGSTSEELHTLLDEYKKADIENILALRGDPPEGETRFEAVSGGFSYATDLISLIHQQDYFSIACATYPEGHPESAGGVKDDIRYLKMKQDGGAGAAMTQYFFDNEVFYRFRDQAVAAGVTIPIIPGIMPIGNYDQIVRFSGMCGASIPDWLHAQISPMREDVTAMRQAGIDIATKQCTNLLEQGVPGLHFYTLNKAEAVMSICQNMHSYPRV